jgi:hypothetical protein
MTTGWTLADLRPERGPVGRTGARGESGVGLSDRRLLVIFAVTVVAFTAVAFRTEVNQRAISRNATRIEQVVYAQCVLRNEGVTRQNVLIDSAIAAERRRPKPDAKRLHDLTEFKGAIVDCGRPPR